MTFSHRFLQLEVAAAELEVAMAERSRSVLQQDGGATMTWTLIDIEAH